MARQGTGQRERRWLVLYFRIPGTLQARAGSCDPYEFLGRISQLDAEFFNEMIGIVGEFRLAESWFS